MCKVLSDTQTTTLNSISHKHRIAHRSQKPVHSRPYDFRSDFSVHEQPSHQREEETSYTTTIAKSSLITTRCDASPDSASNGKALRKEAISRRHDLFKE